MATKKEPICISTKSALFRLSYILFLCIFEVKQTAFYSKKLFFLIWFWKSTSFAHSILKRFMASFASGTLIWLLLFLDITVFLLVIYIKRRFAFAFYRRNSIVRSKFIFIAWKFCYFIFSVNKAVTQMNHSLILLFKLPIIRRRSV